LYERKRSISPHSDILGDGPKVKKTRWDCDIPDDEDFALTVSAFQEATSSSSEITDEGPPDEIRRQVIEWEEAVESCFKRSHGLVELK
jgi:hypothetical protein